MKKIVVLLGKSGAGKTKICKELEKQLDLQRIITCTSRPQREGEIDGLDYYFKNKETIQEYINKDIMIEYSNYNNWLYGTCKKDIPLNKNSIIVLEPNGLINFIKKIGVEKIIPVYIEVDDKIRLLRSLNRENNPNCYEISRRLLADTINFKVLDILNSLDNKINLIHIDNNGLIENSISQCVKKIKPLL